MKALVRGPQGKLNPVIRSKAVEIVKYIPKKQWRERIFAIWEYVCREISYVRDITDVETLHWPVQVMEQRAGDCDDQATLIASLLESIGVPTRFKAVGFQLGRISHVYAQAKIGDKWISLETTEKVPFGWQPPGIKDQIIVDN